MKTDVLTEILRGREDKFRDMSVCHMSTGQSRTLNNERCPLAEDKVLSKIVTKPHCEGRACQIERSYGKVNSN